MARPTTRARIKSLARRLLPVFAYRTYRRIKITREVRAYPSRRVRHCFDGHELEIILEDPLAEGWYDTDWPDIPELIPLKDSRLRRGARVFDLGAHQCVVAMVLAHTVGPAGTIIAIEAEPHNADVGRRNVATNELRNIEVLNAAIADTDGEVRFAIGLNGAIDTHRSRASIRLPAVTLDSLMRTYGRPDVVLIDVEGYEAHALRGARSLLAERWADFMIELHIGCGLEDMGAGAKDVIEPLTRHGYTLFIASGEHPLDWVPLVPDAPILERSFVFARAL